MFMIFPFEKHDQQSIIFGPEVYAGPRGANGGQRGQRGTTRTTGDNEGQCLSARNRRRAETTPLSRTPQAALVWGIIYIIIIIPARDPKQEGRRGTTGDNGGQRLRANRADNGGQRCAQPMGANRADGGQRRKTGDNGGQRGQRGTTGATPVRKKSAPTRNYSSINIARTPHAARVWGEKI